LAFWFRLLFFCAIRRSWKFIWQNCNHGIVLDYVYLSFVTYTTVGYGDLVASGYLRYLTGVEALVGLILITWSASFLFIEMGKYWRVKKK
jgi:hypothetical protein